MRHTSSEAVPGVFIPDEILYAEDLRPIDVRILAELRRMPREEDGTLKVRALRVAMKTNCTDATVAKRIRYMAERGWLAILEVTEGGGGGFRLAFKRAAVLLMLVSMLGAAGGLHKTLRTDGDRARGKLTELHIIRQRRRKRHPSHHESPAETSLQAKGDWFKSIRAQSRHPLGQLQPSTTGQRVA